MNRAKSSIVITIEECCVQDPLVRIQESVSFSAMGRAQVGANADV